MALKPLVLDFTNVREDGGRFNRAHRVPGDYRAKITKVEDAKSKKSGEKMWLYTIKQGSATYPYYCTFTEQSLWKLRTLFAAAGVSIPSKRVKLNPERVVGREIGVSLDDDEYEGRMRSQIIAVFPTSELTGEDTSDEEDADEDEEEDEEDEDEEDETEEEEDEEEEEEEEPPPPPKKSKKSKTKGKTRRKTDVEDEELEELDIEDI